MFTRGIGIGSQYLLEKIVGALSLFRIHPNMLTAIGLVINIVAAVLFATGHFFSAGLVIVCAGLFDMVDGRVARTTNTATSFGAFFDSVIDRYSDMVLFIGLLVYYSRAEQLVYVILVGLVMAGSVMISYTRARAESLIPTCKVGFLERPERIVLIIIGALINRMEPVLWIMAVLSNITVVHRIFYTWQHTQKDTASSAGS
jgi:CDP-diacylglycerol--glycerol-3-phosphate 3-phosphatidyltransferase